MANKSSWSLEQRGWKLEGIDTIMAEVAQQNHHIQTSPGFSSSSAGSSLDFAYLDVGDWVAGMNRWFHVKWSAVDWSHSLLISSASVWPREQWSNVGAARLHLRCLNLIKRVNASVYVWILCLDASPGKSRPPAPSRHTLIHTHENTSSLTPRRTFKSAVGEASTNLYSLTLARTHGDSL